MPHEIIYRTVDIERRGFGRRYTWLPVDELSREGFRINCAGAYVQPQMYDIRVGDIVRWREGERQIEGVIAEVERDGEILSARVDGIRPLPPEEFHP